MLVFNSPETNECLFLSTNFYQSIKVFVNRRTIDRRTIGAI